MSEYDIPIMLPSRVKDAIAKATARAPVTGEKHGCHGGEDSTLPGRPSPGSMAVARVDDLERGGRARALAMGLGLDVPLYTAPPESKALAQLRALIADTAHAITFQTLGQYRTALLRAIDQLAAKE